MRLWGERVVVVLFVESLLERDLLCEVLLHWYLIGALDTRGASAGRPWGKD